MPTNPRTIARWILTVVIVSVVSINHEAIAAETISVRTKSGRTFRGVVDVKSDATTVWLRFGTAQAHILRPIDWSQVVSATHNGRELDVAAFRGVAADVKSAAPKLPPRAKTLPTTVNSDAQRAQWALNNVPPRVASLEIAAYPANWDRDVEVDGLIITVVPRGANGEPLPTAGTLEVELLTEMSRVHETIAAGQSRIRNERIGRWTRRVEPEHFGVMGASYRLPFQAVHPEFERNLIDLSLINARFSVPGAGTFNASTTATRIRPYSTVRDRYENRHGGRFAPIERTGRGKVE